MNSFLYVNQLRKAQVSRNLVKNNYLTFFGHNYKFLSSLRNNNVQRLA